MRVIFSCLPAFGHLQPMLPLATACAQAGHDVLVATGPGLTSRAARFGLDASAVGPSLAGIERQVQRGGDGPRGVGLHRVWDTYTYVHRFPKETARARAADLVPLARTWKADLVVHDVTDFAAPLAAALSGIPSALHSWGPPLPAKIMSRAGVQAAALWQDAGLPAPPAGGMHRGAYLDICPPSIWPADAAELAHVQPLQAAATGEPWPEPSEQLDRLPYDTSVHVTLGTVANRAQERFRFMLDALSELELNLIVTIGPDQEPGAFGKQPENVVVASYIPIDLVLPRCRAIVAHGGSGTMLAALRHGVPQLLLPYDADNVRNADLCEAAGVAVQLSPRALDPEQLCASVHQLVDDPGTLTAARRIKDEMLSMPAPEQVVPVLESLAAAGATPGA